MYIGTLGETGILTLEERMVDRQTGRQIGGQMDRKKNR